jgi:hypothetical protein
VFHKRWGTEDEQPPNVRFDDLRLGLPLQLTWTPDDKLYVTAVPT